MVMAISPDMPPRHRNGRLCMQAIISGNCPYGHDYHAGEMSPEEKRWWYVELMLEELAQLAPDSGQPPAGDTYEVDEVLRAEDGLIATIMGTRSTWADARTKLRSHPYILGDV